MLNRGAAGSNPFKAKDRNSPLDTAMGGEKSPMASTRDGQNADFQDVRIGGW